AVPLRPDDRWDRSPLTPCSCCCVVAAGRPLTGLASCELLFGTRLRDPREEGADLGFPVPPVAPQGPDRRQLAGVCPACDRCGSHGEHRCDLRRGKQGLSLGRACRHVYGLSSWTGTAILRLLYSAPCGVCRGCPIWPTETILPSPAVTSRPPGAKIL